MLVTLRFSVTALYLYVCSLPILYPRSPSEIVERDGAVRPFETTVFRQHAGAPGPQWQRPSPAAATDAGSTAGASTPSAADPDREAGVQDALDTCPPDGRARSGRVDRQDQHAGAPRSEQTAQQRRNVESQHRGSQSISVVPRSLRKATFRHANGPVR